MEYLENKFDYQMNNIFNKQSLINDFYNTGTAKEDKTIKELINEIQNIKGGE